MRRHARARRLLVAGGAGYYLGTYCKCGPYSRETDYMKTRKEAEEALAQWKLGNRVKIRT